MKTNHILAIVAVALAIAILPAVSAETTATFTEGQTKVLTDDGDAFEVTLLVVGGSGDDRSAKFMVDGEISSPLTTTQRQVVNDAELDIESFTASAAYCMRGPDQSPSCTPNPDGALVEGAANQYMIGSPVTDTLAEGETENHLVGGAIREVTLLVVGDTEAKLMIDGLVSDALREGDRYQFPDGLVVELDQIIETTGTDLESSYIAEYTMIPHTYEVTLVIVGDDQAKFLVDGEVTDAIKNGETDTLSDGITIRADDIKTEVELILSSQLGQCSDSDGGKDYYEKGTATYPQGTGTDSCLSGGLTEYYCDSGRVERVTGYDCPYGCSDGACEPAPTGEWIQDSDRYKSVQGNAWGSFNAPVTMEAWIDLESPFVEQFWEETVPKLYFDYIDEGELRIVVRQFPLTSHENAYDRAVVAECKRDDNTMFSTIENYLINDATSIEPWNCDESAAAERVDADLAKGRDIGVTGTPTFFINGEKVVGAQSYEAYQTVIDAELDVDKDMCTGRSHYQSGDSIEIDADLEDGVYEVEADYDHEGRYSYTLYTSDREAALTEIMCREGLTRDQALQIIDWDTDDGDDHTDTDDDRDDHDDRDAMMNGPIPQGWTFDVAGHTIRYVGVNRVDFHMEFVIDGAFVEASLDDHGDQRDTFDIILRGEDYDGVLHSDGTISVEAAGNIRRTGSGGTTDGDQSCVGCQEDDLCYEVGTRVRQGDTSMFCDVDNALKEQKPEGAACENNFECSTNQCSSGVCIDLVGELEENRSLMERILAWIDRLFN